MNLWGEKAACGSISPKIWGAIEDSVDDNLHAYTGRTKRNRAYNAAIPALTICRDCPVLMHCRTWAGKSKYSGIAGGLIFNNGAVVTPPK